MRGRVGTLAWARRTGGRLSATERLGQLTQAIGVQLGRASSSWLRRLGLFTPRQRRAALQEIRAPDTGAARAAAELCIDASPDFLANHCFRTYAWAVLLGARDGLRYDDELLYVACVLHDIGLTAAIELPAVRTSCFAVDGALAAAALVGRLGWSGERRDAMAEAISLHLNVRARPRDGAEQYLLHEGTSLDLTGARYGQITREARAGVLDSYPRLGIEQRLPPMLREEVAARPETRLHFLMRSLHFERLVVSSPFTSERASATDPGNRS